MSRALGKLEKIRSAYGGEAAARKRALLSRLASARLATARQVFRLHEALCFLQAYPDDAEVLALVERMLSLFSSRRDVARHREALEGSGIGGTPTVCPFYAPTARWLARRWGGHLAVDWRNVDRKDDLDRLLPRLVLFAETPALDELDPGPRSWVRRLKGPAETDASFLIRRFGSLRMPPPDRDTLYEALELPVRLSPGPDTPARTRAKLPGFQVAFQSRPLDRSRPDLRVEARRRPREVRDVSPREADRLIDAARTAMITRERDLEVFEHANRRDARLVLYEDGLAFACLGAVPEARLLLDAVYGFLTLKNGVPIGYVLSSALFGSAEVAYNVFESFRGGEAALVYARVLSTLRHLFGADSFTVFPYQLGGLGNDEALRSGAFWFYRKLGFCPRDPKVLRLLRAEEARMNRRPSHRSDLLTLKKLAAENVFLHLGRSRTDVLGILELPNVGLKVMDSVAARFGSERERAARVLSEEARHLLGLPSLAGFSPGERLWFERWAPLVTILPGIRSWSTADRRRLVGVIRAKGGRRESDYVPLFDAHCPLRRAVAALAAPEPDSRT